MEFKSRSTKKSTPSRRTRKGERNSTFIFNKSIRAKLNREKRAAKAETGSLQVSEVEVKK